MGIAQSKRRTQLALWQTAFAAKATGPMDRFVVRKDKPGKPSKAERTAIRKVATEARRKAQPREVGTTPSSLMIGAGREKKRTRAALKGGGGKPDTNKRPTPPVGTGSAPVMKKVAHMAEPRTGGPGTPQNSATGAPPGRPEDRVQKRPRDLDTGGTAGAGSHPKKAERRNTKNGNKQVRPESPERQRRPGVQVVSPGSLQTPPGAARGPEGRRSGLRSARMTAPQGKGPRERDVR